MRKKNIEIAKEAASDLVRVLFAALEEVGVQLNLDQQLLVLQRLKAAIDGPENGRGGAT